VPKGYESTNEAAEYLKLKSFVSLTTLKDADLTSKNLLKKTVDAFEALQPLIHFVNEAVEA